MRSYTEEEIIYLKENFLEKTNKTLSIELDRTLDGIIQKLKELGLVRRQINPYTEEEKKYILDNIRKKTISQIAVDLGRSQGGVSKFISKNIIKKTRKKQQTYLENIDEDIVPFFSKGDNYYGIIEQMKINDSFEFPESDRQIVNNQKYMFVRSLDKDKDVIFSIRKTEIKEGFQFCRIWRLM